MCFESANRLLVQLFTGTVGQTEVICRRYLENQALLEVDIEDDSISQIVTAWSGQSAEVGGNRTFKQDFLETEFVQAARIVHKNADIYSRVQIGSLYFNPACYRRNTKAPNGNLLFEKNGNWICGKILYFLGIPDCDEKYVFLRLFKIFKYIEGPDECNSLYFAASETCKTALVPMQKIVKLFCIQTSTETWCGKVPTFVDHK